MSTDTAGSFRRSGNLSARLGSASGSGGGDVGKFELPQIGFLSSLLKKEADETLFWELARRGYDLSKLRDEQTAAEIYKIG